jgi:hypothetical protein
VTGRNRCCSPTENKKATELFHGNCCPHKEHNCCMNPDNILGALESTEENVNAKLDYWTYCCLQDGLNQVKDGPPTKCCYEGSFAIRAVHACQLLALLAIRVIIDQLAVNG